MNNSLVALNPINSSNGEIKYINGNCLSMPISNANNGLGSIDQNQMLQIQQFLNDLQQQQPSQQQNILAAAECLSLNDLNQQQSLQNLLDIVVTSPNSSQQQQQQQQTQQTYYQTTNSTQQQNSLILSPNSIIKLDPQYVHTQQQQHTQSQQQIFIQNQQHQPHHHQQQQQQQQQQQIESQVHTIMLNGQPALFIPASSAMSSNLLCQMLMNNNNTNPSTNQVYSDTPTHPIQLQLPHHHQQQQQQQQQQQNTSNLTPNTNNSINSTDYQSLLGNNQIIISNQTNDISNTMQTETNDHHHHHQQQNVINLAQVLNGDSNNANTLQFILPNTTNELDTQNQIVCKIEQDVVQPIQQQQQQQVQQQHFILHNGNNATQIAADQNQLSQQIICIQPDGNITFQTLPFLISQPQTQPQEDVNLAVIAASTTTTNTNPTTTLSNTTNATTKKKTKISKPKITPTVASVLSSPDKLKAKLLKDDLINKSNGKKSVNNKVAIILNSNENRLKQQQLQQEEQSIQIDMQSPQQWVFMNGSCIDGQVIINTSQTMNANNDSSSSSSKNDNENNTVTLDNILNSSQNGGIKRKRKACDCPNCLKYRENSMTPEELAKKRTHRCHKCTKEYNKTSHLRAHLRAHDNYRPYVCDFKTCGKSFTRSDELKRHKRIHNDDRNFPCSICKKKFLRSDHLNKHLLVHSKSAAAAAAAAAANDGNQENKQSKPRKSTSNTIKKIKIEETHFVAESANISVNNQMASSASSSASVG